MVKYILASGSPRRRELLEQAGISFEIFQAQGEEISAKESPEDVVEELSYRKADEVAGQFLMKALGIPCIGNLLCKIPV